MLYDKPKTEADELLQVLPGERQDKNVNRCTHSLKDRMADEERNYIYDTLQKCDWKIQETADMLNIDRSSLFKKMKKYGIDKPEESE